MYQIGRSRTLKVCDAEDKFRKVISDAAVFSFNMSEIQLLREQLMQLIQNLHFVHQTYLKERASREAADESEAKKANSKLSNTDGASSSRETTEESTETDTVSHDHPVAEVQGETKVHHEQEGITLLATLDQRRERELSSAPGRDPDPSLGQSLNKHVEETSTKDEMSLDSNLEKDRLAEPLDGCVHEPSDMSLTDEEDEAHRTVDVTGTAHDETMLDSNGDADMVDTAPPDANIGMAEQAHVPSVLMRARRDSAC